MVDLNIFLHEQYSSEANVPSLTSAGSNLDKMVQSRARLQQLLIGKKQAGTVSPQTDLSSSQISEQPSLEGGSRLGKYTSSWKGLTLEKDQNTERGSMLESGLILGRGPKLGGDQGLGGDLRPEYNLNFGRVSTLKGGLSLGGGQRLGRNKSSRRDQWLDKNKSKKRYTVRQPSKPGKGLKALNGPKSVKDLKARNRYMSCKRCSAWLKLKSMNGRKSTKISKPRKPVKDLVRKKPGTR